MDKVSLTFSSVSAAGVGYGIIAKSVAIGNSIAALATGVPGPTIAAAAAQSVAAGAVASETTIAVAVAATAASATTVVGLVAVGIGLVGITVAGISALGHFGEEGPSGPAASNRTYIMSDCIVINRQ